MIQISRVLVGDGSRLPSLGSNSRHGGIGGGLSTSSVSAGCCGYINQARGTVSQQIVSSCCSGHPQALPLHFQFGTYPF